MIIISNLSSEISSVVIEINMTWTEQSYTECMLNTFRTKDECLY